MPVIQFNHTVSADNSKEVVTSGVTTQKKSNSFTIPVIGKKDGCSFSFLKQKPAVNANEYWGMLNQAEQSAKASSDSNKDFLRALKIAKRIMNGDRVPLKDKMFLMNFSMEMYTMAVMLAKSNDDPKDYESVLDEEENEHSEEAEADSDTETVSSDTAGEPVTTGTGEGTE